MSYPRPKELIPAEELIYNENVEEVLEIIYNFEKYFDEISHLVLGVNSFIQKKKGIYY